MDQTNFSSVPVFVVTTTHHTRPFSAIEGIEQPFLILFFILVGASLQMESVIHLGLIGIAYIFLRALGRIFGAWVGGKICHAESSVSRLMGLALLPQAGVALGMALVATLLFPHLSEIIMPIVIGSTVLFEIVGPIITRQVLIHVGEAEVDQ